MSRISIGSLLLAAFCLIIIGIFTMLLGIWHQYLWAPIVLCPILVLISFIVDRAFYLDFLSMKTTKHGMNMGVLILLAIALVGSVNYLAVRHNKTFDLTKEKLNSLSDQTAKILAGIKDDIEIKLFFDPRNPQAMEDKMRFRDTVKLFQDKHNGISYKAINVLAWPNLAKDFSVTTPQAAAFVVYKGQKAKAQELSEQGVTNSLIAITHPKKVLYYLQGQSEIPLESQGPNKADTSALKKALEDSGYEIKTLTLGQLEKLPDDCKVIAIIGPKSEFFERELNLLTNFTKNGGSLFIAINPEDKHNLKGFLQKYGIEFSANYVIDLGQRQNMAYVAGAGFSKTNSITKDLDSENERMIFVMPSTLKKTASLTPSITVEELVKTGPMSISTAKLPEQTIDLSKEKVERGPHVVVMSSKGFLDEASKANPLKEFNIVAFADVEFLIGGGLESVEANRNVVLNSFAALMKDTDLISIRPKAPVGSNFTITGMQANIMFYGIFFPIAILFFFASGLIWWRRRSA
ncbi:MAG: GldG family protein [Pseudomonadota bacterium]|nr:GldG family protein [Pseudomonadota bacterium]